MANGAIASTNGGIKQVLMLDAIDSTALTGTSLGVWIDFGEFLQWGSLEVRGIAGGTVLTLFGDNVSTSLPDATVAAASAVTSIGTFTANGIYSITMCRYMRIAVSTAGTGNASAAIIAGRAM